MSTYISYCSTPIGKLKLTATKEYITSIVFDDHSIEDESTEETDVLTNCNMQLQAYFSGARTYFDLPLKQNGTNFQEKIWEHLYAIPYGKTISYSELALRFGDIKAIRAVAAANGKNKLCILIPCHRVIGKNRTLTGYSGGLWRKQWLLNHEAKFTSGVQELNF